VLHHKVFDLGAFTLTPDWVLVVSDQVNGTTGLQEALLDHHGRKVRPPQRREWRPESVFLDWHKREVFKGEARALE
jgi:putative restriction endonuclease